MTDQHDLDRLLVAFFRAGTNELADRVIDGALDQIDHTPQRRPLRVPRRFLMTQLQIRLATAAVIGVLVIGGSVYLFQRGQPSVGGPSATPGLSSGPGESASPSTTPGLTVAPARAASWIATGRMSDTWNGTLTLLLDGKVLAAGGGNDGTSAWLYDPVTGSWTATGSMVTRRYRFSATLLRDGKVLVAGGDPQVSKSVRELASAELYDPVTGTWSATGSMHAARSGQTATLLLDGQVLVAGGNGRVSGGYGSLASAELYDPAAGSWNATGGMGTARQSNTATLLSNGKVLVAGGAREFADGNSRVLASAELYDPGTGAWSPTGGMGTPRASPTATLLTEGGVLLAGGYDSRGLWSVSPIASVELYDPASGTWVTTGGMGTPRTSHTATLLTDGRVFVAGGYGQQAWLASAELYDPIGGTWAATVSMGTSHSSLAATLLLDGRVLVAAGGGAFVELYDPGLGR